MKQLLLATHNQHKLDELRRILATVADQLPEVEVVGLDDVGPFDAPKETGATFIDNAVLKARAAASQCHLITIADDSGITIDALNGMPGVLSARWAGQHGDDEANLRLVLAQLADVPDDRLGAAFICAAALVVPGTNRGKVAEERMVGHLMREPRGDERLRLRPDLRRAGRDADERRAAARAQGCHQPPRQGAADARALHRHRVERGRSRVAGRSAGRMPHWCAADCPAVVPPPVPAPDHWSPALSRSAS